MKKKIDPLIIPGPAGSERASSSTELVRVPADFIEVNVSDWVADRSPGAVAPDHIMVDGERFVTAEEFSPPQQRVRDSRHERAIRVINLIDELAPLFHSIDVHMPSRRPMFWGGEVPPMLPGLPADAITRIHPNSVSLSVNLFDYRDPPGTRRRILWTLLKVTMRGPSATGYRRARPSEAEMRRGSLRAPLRFRFGHELLTFDEDSLDWGHTLRVTCEEDSNIRAIRKQVGLLEKYLADPRNLLPLDDWTMQL